MPISHPLTLSRAFIGVFDAHRHYAQVDFRKTTSERSKISGTRERHPASSFASRRRSLAVASLLLVFVALTIVLVERTVGPCEMSSHWPGTGTQVVFSIS